jgi:hypothetical protein
MTETAKPKKTAPKKSDTKKAKPAKAPKEPKPKKEPVDVSKIKLVPGIKILSVNKNGSLSAEVEVDATLGDQKWSAKKNIRIKKAK